LDPTRDPARLPRKPGRRLTPDEIVDQVRQVFELTGNYSETGRICRVSRETARKIIIGTHGQPAEQVRLEPGERFVERARCPECGATLLIVPCRRCKILRGPAGLAGGLGTAGAPPAQLRPADARGQRLLPIVDDPPPAELQPLRDAFELKAEHRRRLEEVRARRERLDPFADIKRGPRPRDRRQYRDEIPF